MPRIQEGGKSPQSISSMTGKTDGQIVFYRKPSGEPKNYVPLMKKEDVRARVGRLFGGERGSRIVVSSVKKGGFRRNRV